MIKKRLSKYVGIFLLLCAVIMPISASAAEQSLSISAPVFKDVFEGYSQPEAKPVILRNTGESYIIYKITLSVDSDNFTITQPAGNIVLAPGAETNESEYMIQPKTGLATGEYTDVITADFGNGNTASAEVKFTVRPKDEEWHEPDPGVPDEDAPQSIDELRAADPREIAKLPRFDSRNYGIVPPVKDQGGSNIC